VDLSKTHLRFVRQRFVRSGNPSGHRRIVDRLSPPELGNLHSTGLVSLKQLHPFVAAQHPPPSRITLLTAIHNLRCNW